MSGIEFGSKIGHGKTQILLRNRVEVSRFGPRTPTISLESIPRENDIVARRMQIDFHD